MSEFVLGIGTSGGGGGESGQGSCIRGRGGPFSAPPLPDLRVSPLGVVPKKDPNKFRLIHHLSFPKGSSVNDGIDREFCSVCYASLDAAVSWVRKFGKGAKTDIEAAFRLLPVHP